MWRRGKNVNVGNSDLCRTNHGHHNNTAQVHHKRTRVVFPIGQIWVIYPAIADIAGGSAVVGARPRTGKADCGQVGVGKSGFKAMGAVDKNLLNSMGKVALKFCW